MSCGAYYLHFPDERVRKFPNLGDAWACIQQLFPGSAITDGKDQPIQVENIPHYLDNHGAKLNVYSDEWSACQHIKSHLLAVLRGF